MTELELLELLGDLKTGYIQEAQGLRSGQPRMGRNKRKKQLVRNVTAIAAILTMVLATGSILGPYLAGHWVRQNQRAEMLVEMIPESAPALSGDAPEEAVTTDQREPKTILLSYYLEGEEVQVTADLFVGEYFSMYVPREGWIHSVIAFGDTQADRWTYAEESLEDFAAHHMLETTREGHQKLYDEQYPIRMTVVYRQETDLAVVQEWVRQMNSGIELLDSAQGSLYSTDMDAPQMEVFFHQAKDGYLVEILEFPLEATEGAGTTMSVMGDTLLPLER